MGRLVGPRGPSLFLIVPFVDRMAEHCAEPDRLAPALVDHENVGGPAMASILGTDEEQPTPA